MNGYELSTKEQFSERIEQEIPEDAVFVIGAGHFGSRAVRLISGEKHGPIFVVDTDHNRLSALEGILVKKISGDGAHFLARHFQRLKPHHVIVPAVPTHLAYEWLREYVGDRCQVHRIEVPEAVKPQLPQTWPGTDGSLIVSYADFICPDACPEPEFCTVTGERRDHPLHDLLTRLNLPGFKVRVLRSRQLAPGLGGYRALDLGRVADEVTKHGAGKWLLGTACKCHGVLTAFEIRKARTHRAP